VNGIVGLQKYAAIRNILSAKSIVVECHKKKKQSTKIVDVIFIKKGAKPLFFMNILRLKMLEDTKNTTMF